MEIYEKLREILDAHPSGAPKSKAFEEILRILFTQEEAAVAVHMSFKDKDLADIAQACGIPIDEVEKRLERLADKAVVYARVKDSRKRYGLLPTIPGLFEFPFMKGKDTLELERLARLWEEYHADAMGIAFAGNPTPLARVVPVYESLKAQTNVLPYEEVRGFIQKVKYYAVTNCACRVSMEKCDKPREVCLIFDAPGRFLVERGYAKEISQNDAIRVLDRAEEAGLVHISNNSQDRPNFICNCCTCCCTVMRGRTQLKHPHAFGISSYESRVNPGNCTACGLCQERCPMTAIVIGDEAAVISGEACIGCGLCVSTCPTEAILLVKRTAEPVIPVTVQEMGLRAAQEKGKLDKFIEIMQR